MKLIRFAALALSVGVSAMAHADWSQVQNEARGQTVYFNAWGGSEATNAYISWAAKEARARFGIDVRHVRSPTPLKWSSGCRLRSRPAGKPMARSI